MLPYSSRDDLGWRPRSIRTYACKTCTATDAIVLKGYGIQHV